jgi:hypothetical protein
MVFLRVPLTISLDATLLKFKIKGLKTEFLVWGRSSMVTFESLVPSSPSGTIGTCSPVLYTSVTQ